MSLTALGTETNTLGLQANDMLLLDSMSRVARSPSNHMS